MFQFCLKSIGDQFNSFWKVISNDEELLDYNSSHCGSLSAWDSSTNFSQSQQHQSGYQQWDNHRKLKDEVLDLPRPGVRCFCEGAEE